jgi:hypothetical protein
MSLLGVGTAYLERLDMPNELIDFTETHKCTWLQHVAAVMGRTEKTLDERLEELTAYKHTGMLGLTEVEDLSWIRMKKFRPTLFPVPGTDSVMYFEAYKPGMYDLQTHVALTTDETFLPMIINEWPMPQAVVDVPAVWRRHVKGIEVHPDKVFYLISPGETSLVQGLGWITIGGWPILAGKKKVTLFKWQKNPTSDDSFLEFVHETLAPLLVLPDPQSPADQADPAAPPAQD